MEYSTLIASIIVLLLLKYCIIPFLIQKIIEVIPLERDPHFYYTNYLFKDYGLELWLIATIDFQIPFGYVTFTVPYVDVIKDGKVLTIFLSKPITIEQQDMTINQKLTIDIYDAYELHLLLRKVVIDPQEFYKLSFQVQGILSVDCFGITFKNINFKKNINIGVMEQQKLEYKRKQYLRSLNESMLTTMFIEAGAFPVIQREQPFIQIGPLNLPQFSIKSPKQLSDLWPKCHITPFVTPKYPIEAGLSIEFSKPPGLCLDIGQTTFEIVLNDSTLASVVVEPWKLSQTIKDTNLKLSLYPTVVNPFNTINVATGIATGIISSLMNGVLYGEWGKDLSVIGIKNISVCNVNGKRIPWLDKVLKGIEFDIDIYDSLTEMPLESTDDLKIAVRQLTANLVQKLGCTIQ